MTLKAPSTQLSKALAGASLPSRLKASLFKIQVHKQVWNFAVELSGGQIER